MKFNTFTIYGERKTGTNFLRKLIVDNFNIENICLPDGLFGWKHFFGSEENKEAIKSSTACVILSIVRNPIDYLVSFFNTPHHQPEERRKDFLTFISSEFYSIYDCQNEDYFLDKHFEDGGRRYKDIFEMRNVKNKFLYLTIPLLTSNSYFMKYEDLKLYPEKILEEIKSKFDLKQKQDKFIVEKYRVLPQIKGWNEFEICYDETPKENYIIEDVHAKKIIKDKLDFDMEIMIGYNKDDIIRRLI